MHGPISRNSRTAPARGIPEHRLGKTQRRRDAEGKEKEKARGGRAGGRAVPVADPGEVHQLGETGREDAEGLNRGTQAEHREDDKRNRDWEGVTIGKAIPHAANLEHGNETQNETGPECRRRQPWRSRLRFRNGRHHGAPMLVDEREFFRESDFVFAFTGCTSAVRLRARSPGAEQAVEGEQQRHHDGHTAELE